MEMICNLGQGDEISLPGGWGMGFGFSLAAVRPETEGRRVGQRGAWPALQSLVYHPETVGANGGFSLAKAIPAK
jgi:hypothetical protein